MYCQNPTIILKKNLYRVLHKLGRKAVYTDGRVIYPLGNKLPTPKQVGATKDNYKDWSILTEDGELIPLFQEVTCGHCILCMDKKAKEWSTRSSCETQTAIYPPVFITLTYDDAFLPSDGVNKKHLQNFIKRFRENWCRMYKVKRLDLRYFAVSEYGSKYGRPHYHLLFWNVPNDMKNESPMTQKIADCVGKSWSEPVSKDDYYKLLPMHQLYFHGRYYKKFGRTEVTVDRGNSASYCMKYMRKPKDVPHQWTQPTFYLSSRRGGGIGMRYLNDIIDSIRIQEPAKTTILVGTAAHPYSLPRSFKDKIFPSLSMIIPTHIRCMLCRFDTLYKYFAEITMDDKFDMVDCLHDSLREQYGRAYDFIVQCETMYHHNDPLVHIKHKTKSQLWQTMYVSFVQCWQWQPDTKKLEYFINLKDKRQEILQKCRFLEIDAEYEAYNIHNRLIKKQLYEKF